MTAPVAPRHLSHAQLVVLAHETLLAGHLIDRAGMPTLLGHVATDVMAEVAIAEWRGASPIYTRRMQQLLGFGGDDVATIFKGMQLDIGAPPQFLDFRYTVHDAHHGEFHLAHCGALADVEPMGEELVHTMCHTIEDPTFPATACATNPRAVVSPVHRPPRSPAQQADVGHPACRWTVDIDPARDAVDEPVEAQHLARSRAASVPLPVVDDDADSASTDYAGPLEADFDFTARSASTLAAIVDEAALQGHLLVLSFAAAAAERLGPDVAAELARAQLAGAGGVTSGRLSAALDAGTGLDAIAAVLAVHPAFLPRTYVCWDVQRDGDRLIARIDDCVALDESPLRSWPGLLVDESDPPAGASPLDAIVQGVDPRARSRRIDLPGAAAAWEIVLADEPAPESAPVTLTRFSTGATFTFVDR